MLFVGLLSSAHILHLAAADCVTNMRVDVPTVWTSNGQALRHLALGQYTTAADIFWLRMVQYLGTKAASEAEWPQIRQLIDEITDLDPDYGYAYEVGGLILSSTGRIEESDAILEKGMDHVPNRWQLPFLAAHNHWYERGNLMDGARLLFRAASIEGSPNYLTGLAARLSSGANQIDVAIDLLTATLAQGVPDQAGQLMLRKRDELLVERDLRWIEGHIAQYLERWGTYPTTLAALLASKQVDRLPVAPDGSLYEYDPSTGAVFSAMLPTRLNYEARLGAAKPRVAIEE